MLKEIQQIITHDMRVEGISIGLESTLGETGIGLDSQEIVELTCVIEKRFNVKLPGVLFSKKSTIAEAIQRIQEAQVSQTSKSLFEGKTEATLDIHCNPEEAYKAIYEMEKWPLKLPHVKDIKVLYNDGVYQEFLMDVLSDSGVLQVRSIRRCLPEEGIVFFQPTPPKFLKHHCGGWSFQKIPNGCNVRTWHQWNIEPKKAIESFPGLEENSIQVQVSSLLRSHAELALNMWKKNLEG
jgi:acyl carrier protein